MTPRQIGGQFTTVVDVLRAAAHENAEVEAYVEMAPAGSEGVVPAGVDGRRRLSFGAWNDASDRVAGLLSSLGVSTGDVVCLALPSSIDYAVCYQAAARLGAVTSGVNMRLGAAEKAFIAARLRPSVTVVDDADAAGEGADTGTMGASAHTDGDRHDWGSVWGTVLPRAALASAANPGRGTPPMPALGGRHPVAVVWTSGSTGVPRGAVFDHDNLRAVAAGTDVLSRPGDRRLSPLPFAHVGYMTRAWDEIGNAVTTVITPQPWTAASAIELLATERVTVGQGVPTQWALVLGHPALDGVPLPALRIVATGASRVPPDLVRAMRSRFGCPVVVRYTSTESSLGTGTQPGDPDDVVATTVGRPVPGVELDVVDDEGRSVAPDTVGRVRLRSAAAMRGYVGDAPRGALVDAAATANVVDPAGWLTTGDLGKVGADGNLRLVGREAEMYIRGGYNVYPAEVERVLGELPVVAEVAVVGVPDNVLGEIGVAFVVPSLGTPVPRLEHLRSECRRTLADYKAPDRLHVLAELPVTPMAKIDKKALTQLATALESHPAIETQPAKASQPAKAQVS